MEMEDSTSKPGVEEKEVVVSTVDTAPLTNNMVAPAAASEWKYLPGTRSESQRVLESSVTVLQSNDPNRVTEDIFGHKRRACATVRCLDWSFIIISLSTLGTVFGLTVERLVYYAREPGTDFAMALVLLINTGFCMHYIISGIMRERLYEIYMYLCGAIIVVGYCIIDYLINPEKRTEIKLIRLIIASSLGPLNVLLACMVLRTFGWLEFRIVGASESMQNMFRQRNLFYSLLTFDLQASASYLTLALSEQGFSTHLETKDIVVSCSLLAFCLIWVYIGWFGVKREVPAVCVFFAATAVVMPCFVIYHLIQIFLNAKQFYAYSLPIITFIAGFLVCLHKVVLLFNLRKAWQNFDHNLREHVFNFDNVLYSAHKISDLCHCFR